MKEITIVPSIDDYGERFWRLANLGTLNIDQSKRIAEMLTEAGIEAFAELDRMRPVVHVPSPDVLSKVRALLGRRMYCHGCGESLASVDATWHSGEGYCQECENAPADVDQ